MRMDDCLYVEFNVNTGSCRKSWKVLLNLISVKIQIYELKKESLLFIFLREIQFIYLYLYLYLLYIYIVITSLYINVPYFLDMYLSLSSLRFLSKSL